MKTKLYIFLVLLSLSHFAFGQTNGGGTINLKVTFDEDIYVENLEVFYSQRDGSKFNEIYFETDTSSNSLILKADHEWWASPSFPTIVFSCQKKEKIYMFYLVSSSTPYVKYNFNKKIIFSFNSPNVHIYRNNKDGNFEVDYIGKGFYFGSGTSINELIKINPKK